jgi:hypothetical protein
MLRDAKLIVISRIPEFSALKKEKSTSQRPLHSYVGFDFGTTVVLSFV